MFSRLYEKNVLNKGLQIVFVIYMKFNVYLDKNAYDNDIDGSVIVHLKD